MLTNYFKTAWRNIWRNRQSSAINVFGLAFGIAVFLCIMQYVAFEWSTNRFHQNADRLFRVNVMDKDGRVETILPPGYAPIIKEKITGIDDYMRIAAEVGSGVITYNDAKATAPKAFRETNVLYVDPGFLTGFTFPLLAGSPQLPSHTVALSQSMSEKLFGAENAVGKTVTMSNQFGSTQYTVGAVYRNMPEASDIRADILLSFATLQTAAGRGDNDWADPSGTESGFTSIYLKLRNGQPSQKIAAEITAFVRSINPASAGDAIYLQPLTEMHLAPSFNYPYQTYGSAKQVALFLAVALLILGIAWINYINLSTAQALNRAREVGVRKVLGASRPQLIGQYLSETFILTLVSVGGALLLVQLLQPLYNNLTGKTLSLAVLNNGLFWPAGVALLFLSSLLSGVYVAFVLTGNKPALILRGKGGPARQHATVRKGLVVFQFTISIVFMIATLVLYRQLQYMQSEKLGMQLDQLLVLKGPTVSSDAQAERNASFKNTLAQLPFVKKYAASNNVPGMGYNFTTNGITRPNPQKGDDQKGYAMLITDDRFFDAYAIQFVQGKTYTPQEAEQAWMNCKKVILNQKAAAQLGFAPGETVVGKKIMWGDQYEVAGVVADYHHLSLREAIKPTIYLPSVSFVFFTIQTDMRNMPAKLETLKKAYNNVFPGNPFEYFFADETFNRQYVSDQKLGTLFLLSAVLAILISCLGLFGLISFTARQRVKEIGIRKVLGATVTDITALLSKDFVKLVFIAIIIAAPLAGWAMQKWLEDFAYRTSLSWWIFAVAGLAALFIALATVGLQAAKAARANPVKNLRTE